MCDRHGHEGPVALVAAIRERLRDRLPGRGCPIPGQVLVFGGRPGLRTGVELNRGYSVLDGAVATISSVGLMVDHGGPICQSRPQILTLGNLAVRIGEEVSHVLPGERRTT